MRRFSLFLALTLLLGLYALAVRADSSDAARAGTPNTYAPDATCIFTPLSFNLSGTGLAGALRPVAISEGDTFAQFIAPPITATASSLGFALVNNDFNGTVSGDVTGTFALANLNGLLITNPEGIFTPPRGIELNDIVITGASGTITAVMAVDLAASPVQPYYPRTFNAYLHSTSTSGSYAPYRYEGAIVGGIMTSSGGSVTINGSVFGRLYTGGGTLTELVLATRNVPPDRATSFEAADRIAQFRRPDFAVGQVAPGHISTRSTFTGTTLGTLNGGFLLDHNALAVDAGANSGKGWLAGEFNFVDTSGDLLTGPWLTDLSSTSPNLSGYLFQVVGTGVYSDSLLFATVTGNLSSGGANFTGSMSGVYCESSDLPTATVTPTAPASSTPAITSTSTSTPVATFTATSVVTATATGTSTSTPVATSSPIPSVTGIPTSTFTAIVSNTPTSTASPTTCPIQFTDVPSSNTFYANIRCLACRGIISGYADGTFRPNNQVTRGQLAKIVSNSAGYSETITGQTFADVPPSHTFYEWIERLTRRGHMTGYACGGPGEPCINNMPYFRPFANATRGQTAKIVSNAAGFTDPPTGQTFQDVPPTHTFYEFIQRLASRNVMGGYPCGGPGEPCVNNRPYFRPQNDVTRGQSAKIVANTFFPDCDPSAGR